MYPLLLFLMPPGERDARRPPGWRRAVYRRFVNLFWAARYPYLVMEKGPLRRLPVELTMANDLPARIAQPLRGPVQYRFDPGARLYFLDQNAWPPEPTAMGPDGRPVHSIWISGSGRADIIVRTPWPLDRLEMEGESPIATVVTVALGAEPVTVQMAPGKVYTFNVNAKGVHGFGDYNYLLTTVSTDGFIPHLMEPQHGLPELGRADPVPAGHFRRNIITEVKTVSSRRTVMCGDMYGSRLRSTGVVS